MWSGYSNFQSSRVNDPEHCDSSWSRNYAALLEYYKEHGTCNAPQGRTYECTLLGMGENGGNYQYQGNLGKWLVTQRRMKRGVCGVKMKIQRQAKLQILVDEGLVVGFILFQIE